MGRFLFYTALFILFFLIINSIRKFFRASMRGRKTDKNVYSNKQQEKKPSQIDKNRVVDADYEDL
jgi:hypothetical protein